jgi:hypothetical protein
MTYKGSCHCGQVEFEAEGELTEVVDCNCSMCLRKGALLWGVPGKQFRLLTSEDKLTTYQFNKKAVDHKYCSTCGMQPYSSGHDSSGDDYFMINVRCLDDVDLTSLKIQPFDGRSY